MDWTNCMCCRFSVERWRPCYSVTGSGSRQPVDGSNFNFKPICTQLEPKEVVVTCWEGRDQLSDVRRLWILNKGHFFGWLIFSGCCTSRGRNSIEVGAEWLQNLWKNGTEFLVLFFRYAYVHAHWCVGAYICIYVLIFVFVSIYVCM